MEYMINPEKITNNLWVNVTKETLLKIRKFFGFLNEGKFYTFINKCSAEDIDSLCYAIPFYSYFDTVVDKRATPLRALLMIFVIEGATFAKGYLDFSQWLKQNGKNGPKLNLLVNQNEDKLKQQIELLYKEYKVRYGDIKNFNRLFVEFLEFNEKLQLIKSFSYINDKGEDFYFCYDKEKNCCDDMKCYLKNNEKEINLPLQKMAKMLFDFRCAFAHRAKLSHFTYSPKKEDYSVSFLIGEYDGKLLKIELSHDVFEDLARKMIYRYLNQL